MNQKSQKNTRLRGLCVFVFCALAGGVGARGGAQEQVLRDVRPFRSGIEVTGITATVRDVSGRLVTGLTRDAFEVYEDSERQTISQFTNERVPVSVGVLLDISDSMYGQRIQDARAAVDHFLFDLLDPGDEFFILAFNHKPRVLTGWTSSPDVVRRALEDIRPSGGTAAYDAVLAGLPVAERRNRQRIAFVLLSDGADTASNATVRDVHSALMRSPAFVYAIALDSPGGQAINTRVNATTLRQITDDSGGRTEVVRTADELADATARIAEELNSQYVLGYTSSHPSDGRFHSIRVRVRGSDYRVRARNGYVIEASAGAVPKAPTR